MSPLLKKLNLKSETTILVLDAPASLEPELALIEGVTVQRSAAKLKEVQFAMAFVTTLAAVEKAATQINAKAVGDVMLPMRISPRHGLAEPARYGRRDSAHGGGG